MDGEGANLDGYRIRRKRSNAFHVEAVDGLAMVGLIEWRSCRCDSESICCWKTDDGFWVEE